MVCHPKNTEYQKRWRELNCDKYLKQNVKGRCIKLLLL